MSSDGGKGVGFRPETPVVNETTNDPTWMCGITQRGQAETSSHLLPFYRRMLREEYGVVAVTNNQGHDREATPTFSLPAHISNSVPK